MQAVKKMKNFEDNLKEEYLESLKDDDFRKLVQDLKISPRVGRVNTSLLNDCIEELKNCRNCKGLYECPNRVEGFTLYPKVEDNRIDIGYKACKYKLKQDELLKNKKTNAKELENASFKNILLDDKKRVEIVKWLMNFYDNFDGITNSKGLYLHGSFGSGKTYLIYALLNELKKNKKVDFRAVYFPEILRTLKDDWDTYNEKINLYSTIPILLIDDIGAETVSEWGRDEVLGTILQNRMNNELTTFFTSNLTIEELENHLAMTKNTTDKLKASRIIERIKQLTEDKELISPNKRH